MTQKRKWKLAKGKGLLESPNTNLEPRVCYKTPLTKVGT